MTSWFAKLITSASTRLLLLAALLSYLPQEDAWPVVGGGSGHVGHHSIIVIPYPKTISAASSAPGEQGDATLQRLDSFAIDGDLLWQQVSARGIAMAIAERPELDLVVNSLDGVTLGQLYRTVFPEGVLKRLGVTTEDANQQKAIDVYDGLNDESHFEDDDGDKIVVTDLTGGQLEEEFKNETDTSTPTSTPPPSVNTLPTNLLTSSTESQTPPEVTAKVGQLALQTIYAENETERITRSKSTPVLTLASEAVDISVPEAAALLAPSGGNQPASIGRPNSVAFDSAAASTKLREWIKAYFSG